MGKVPMNTALFVSLGVTVCLSTRYVEGNGPGRLCIRLCIALSLVLPEAPARAANSARSTIGEGSLDGFRCGSNFGLQVPFLVCSSSVPKGSS